MSCHHPHRGELPSSTHRPAAIILAEASCHHPHGGELPSSTLRRAAIIHTEASCHHPCHHPRGGERPSSMLRRAAIIHTEVSCHQWRRAAIIARCCSLLASPPHQVTCLGPLTCCAVTSMPWCTCAFTHIPCLHALPERTSSTVTVVPCDLVVATEGY